MAYFDAQTLKDLSIVLSIDRNNNSIFWDEYQVEWCENSGWSQMIIPTPTIATEGDVISIYFWNKSSNSLTLKSVDISNSGLIKEL